jgi:hypothetical protein
MLIESERHVTDPQGLLRRPWFVHMICASGFYIGYGVKTIPGVREAAAEIVRVGGVLTDEAFLIDRAAAALEQAAQK